MSVREHLVSVLRQGVPAQPVFDWATAQGKSQTTVLVQAGKLGYRWDRKANTFVQMTAEAIARSPKPRTRLPVSQALAGGKPAPAYTAPPPEDDAPRRKRQTEDYDFVRGSAYHDNLTRRGYDYVKQVELELPRREWHAMLDKAARSFKVVGDVIAMRDTPAGQRISFEIHDY